MPSQSYCPDSLIVVVSAPSLTFSTMSGLLVCYLLCLVVRLVVFDSRLTIVFYIDDTDPYFSIRCRLEECTIYISLFWARSISISKVLRHSFQHTKRHCVNNFSQSPRKIQKIKFIIQSQE